MRFASVCDFSFANLSPRFSCFRCFAQRCQKKRVQLCVLYTSRQNKTKVCFFFGAANLKLKPINLLACWVMSWFFVSGSVGLQFDLFFRARLKQQWWEGGCSCFFFELATRPTHPASSVLGGVRQLPKLSLTFMPNVTFSVSM